MRFRFEVKESDLMGRNGTLEVGGKVLQTPCLLPVVHPVVQSVKVEELARMGYRGVMTNSYIMYSRKRREAEEGGVHKLVGFDGVVMTDSGGYQALEYGDLGVGVSDVARFQSKIGSDLAVTLDRPTGDSPSRSHALETVRVSLGGAEETIRDFGGSGTVWVGPVQGGLFPDLLRRSAKGLVRAGFGFLALGSPTLIMESYRFADLARMIVATRKAIPYSIPLHLFGAGHPLTMALAVSLGCDTFDSASYILFARRGNYMTGRGVSELREMKYLPCSCEVCARTSVEEMLELEAKDRTDRLAVHNLWALKQEVDACREAVTEGRLWDLLREKTMAHPRLLEAMRVVEGEREFLASGTPALKDKGLLIRDATDLRRPEVGLARERLKGATRRGSKTALLASSTRPVGGRRERKGSDAYRLHPVLGPFPEELDFVYPFSSTVVADGVEPFSVTEAKEELLSMGYSSVRYARERTPSVRSTRRRKAASPSARSSSARPRSPRRP